MAIEIPDESPACACGGEGLQYLEHTATGCSVLPTVLLDAWEADRPLTDDERDAIHQAEERRRARGYDGPRALGWMDAVTPR